MRPLRTQDTCSRFVLLRRLDGSSKINGNHQSLDHIQSNAVSPTPAGTYSYGVVQQNRHRHPLSPFRFRRAQCASKSILPLAVRRNTSQPGPPRAPPMVFRVVALGIDQPSAAWRVGMGGSRRAVAWPSHSRKLQSLPATCFKYPASRAWISDVVHPRPRRPQMQRADLGRR
ncbi:hypothetical protein J3E68DRAFT_388414 [Trichoderma sp. SZMC 28012]